MVSVRRKEINYALTGEIHEVFEHLENHSFGTEDINKVWCTDFTYI